VKILGLNAYHGDASAVLVVDGELVAGVEEERLNRQKHCAGFPSLAAAWCLGDAGVSPRELDHVAISRDPRANLSAKLRRAMGNRNLGFLRSRLANVARIRDVKGALAAALGVPPEELAAEFHNVEHHRAHLASAFFVSPFEDAAVLSIDGFGDFASTMLAHGRGSSLTILDRVLYPHSLGVWYTALSQWLGFRKWGDEGKTMGLAAYGQPRFLDVMRDVVRLEGDTFRLDLDYFVHHREGVDMTWDEGTPTLGRLFSQRLSDVLGPPREPGDPLEARHEDVAASLQARLEEVHVHLLEAIHASTGSSAVCIAGGVGLNAVANGLIRERTPFEDVFVQPAAGDAGTAVGAAYYVWHHQLGAPRSFVMEHAYTGPQYGEDELAAALRKSGGRVRRLDDDELFEFVAGRIADGEVVGWFQGRVEFGPRALGNRSIVADPRRGEMKDILNGRIKHREPFRPFAPSVLASATGDWFQDGYPSPFMVLCHGTQPDKRELMAAVNHVDDSARLQTVTPKTNARYHRLIEAFGRRTGVPMLLNTSFNENEPIVCTPQDAISCFEKTRMDLLVLGNYVVDPPERTRGSALQDATVSERADPTVQRSNPR
jgi:carbamoyltransferase